MTTDAPELLTAELVPIADLHPRPRNYQTHPDDELEHLMESVREHGIYRNVVTARDLTILAGHGVVEACRRLGLSSVPIVRLDLDRDEPRALKVLAGDNEIRHLAEVDDRALSLLLKEIMDSDRAGLLGTGYDPAMLANLIMVTRPASEIADFDAAAEWAGMPDYEAAGKVLTISVHFRSRPDLDDFLEKTGIRYVDHRGGGATGAGSAWWPPKDGQDDMSSLKWVDGEPA